MENAESSRCGRNPGVTPRYPIKGGVVSLDTKADVADSEGGGPGADGIGDGEKRRGAPSVDVEKMT